MSFATNREKPSVETDVLVVLKPRRKVSSWSVYSGAIYQASISFGRVISLEQDGEAMTEGASKDSLSSGEYFYDWENRVLYVNTIPGLHTLVAIYELYLATRDLNWYRTPTDSSTEQVHFMGGIDRAPSINASMGDSAFGFMPTSSSGIDFHDPELEIATHFHASSFSHADIDVYHMYGDLKVSNVSLVYRGSTDRCQYSDGRASITVLDRIDIFRQGLSGCYFNDDRYTAGTIDPDAIGRPIPVVYGHKHGMRAVNVSYQGDRASISTSTNRRWAICANPIPNAYTATVSNSTGGTHTTTETFVDPAPGPAWSSLNDVLYDNADGYGHRFAFYTGSFTSVAVAKGTTIYQPLGGTVFAFDHTAIGSARSNGDTVYSSPVFRVDVIQNGTRYACYPVRDFTVGYDAEGPFTYIEFTSSMESNIGLPETLGPTDTVVVSLFGSNELPTIGGASFGSLHSAVGVLYNPVVIVYDILTRYLGLPEDHIDTDAFQALEPDFTQEIGLSIPETSNEDFPTYVDVLSDILQSCLLRMYLNADLKWSITTVAPMSGTTASDFTDDDLIQGQLDFSFDYADVLTDIVVEYAKMEFSYNPNTVTGYSSKVYVENTDAKYLHKLTRQKTFSTVLSNRGDAVTLAQRLAYLFGDRKGTIKISVDKAFADRLIGEEISITRKALPGHDYDGETEFTRNYVITETSKTSGGVSLTCDDQKGIEDNAGSW